jgi:hypothetical protein
VELYRGLFKKILKEEILLLEGRVSTSKKKLENAISGLAPATQKKYLNGFKLMHLNDPSSNLKYLGWMVNQMVKLKGSSTTTINKIIDLVKSFDELLPQIKDKDINSYKSINMLSPVIEEAKQKKQKKEKEKKAKKSRDVVYDDDEWTVIVPYTHESSCKYGSGTKWCTTDQQSSYYQDYMKNGVLFYFLHKEKKDDDVMYKFALLVDNRDKYKTEDFDPSLGSIFDAKDRSYNPEGIFSFLPNANKIIESIDTYLKSDKTDKIGELDPFFEDTDRDSILRKIISIGNGDDIRGVNFGSIMHNYDWFYETLEERLNVKYGDVRMEYGDTEKEDNYGNTIHICVPPEFNLIISGDGDLNVNIKEGELLVQYPSNDGWSSKETLKSFEMTSYEDFIGGYLNFDFLSGLLKKEKNEFIKYMNKLYKDLLDNILSRFPSKEEIEKVYADATHECKQCKKDFVGSGNGGDASYCSKSCDKEANPPPEPTHKPTRGWAKFDRYVDDIDRMEDAGDEYRLKDFIDFIMSNTKNGPIDWGDSMRLIEYARGALEYIRKNRGDYGDYDGYNRRY